MDHEILIILWESHDGVVGGHYSGKAIALKVLRWGCGGWICSRTPNNMLNLATSIKELGNHLVGMKCCYNW
jgi:hypothetical protein